MRPLMLSVAIVLAVLTVAAPTAAAPIDAGRSQVIVQAPGLAPGTTGSAPLTGELADTGAFTLYAPVAAVRTGNGFYDALLRRTLGSTVTLRAVPTRLLFRKGRVRHFAASGTLQAAGYSFTVPLTVRTVARPDGLALHSFLKLPLGAFGVRTLSGGDPGFVRASLMVFSPAR